MSSTRTTAEWRDDMPRTFSVADLPPNVPTVQARRRRIPAAVLLPRLATLAADRLPDRLHLTSRR